MLKLTLSCFRYLFRYLGPELSCLVHFGSNSVKLSCLLKVTEGGAKSEVAIILGPFSFGALNIISEDNISSLSKVGLNLEDELLN